MGDFCNRRGAKNGMAKLTEDKVRAIRQQYRPMVPSNTKALAADFGVHPRTVIRIVSGEDWHWVD